jgi:nitronate monooxygenase
VILSEVSRPIVQAPLGGGPSTVDLAVAVSDAGGLGFLAGGYLSAEAMAAEIEETRSRTPAAFGVNVFVPGPAGDAAAVAAYARSLAGEADRYGVALGEPRHSDEDWERKLELLASERPAVASFTFGCPAAAVVSTLRGRGVEVWITVTTPDEARAATAAGASVLVVQGIEAGGHRGGFDDTAEQFGVLALIGLTAATSPLPIVAAGGIADARAVAGVLAAGAAAAQIGTGFLLADEAGTHPAHRAALGGSAPTAITRAFSGRRARGIANRFLLEHPDAPSAYSEVHYLTSPLRAAARERGDGDGFNLWAGQAYRLARAGRAAEIVERLTPRRTGTTRSP